MKKILLILLIFSFFLLTSCGAETPADSTSTSSEMTETTETTSEETTDPAVVSKSPADEIPTQKVFRNSNDDMLLEITVNGYKSESLGLDFYVKNTEVIEVVAKVTNISENPDTIIYYWDDCMYKDSGTGTIHNHTFFYDLTTKYGKRMSGLYGLIHIPWYLNFTLESGGSHERTTFFIIGELSNDCDIELTDRKWSDCKGDYKGIKVYNGIYTDGKCEFSGDVKFEYDKLKTEKSDDRSFKITCDISFTVLDYR